MKKNNIFNKLFIFLIIFVLFFIFLNFCKAEEEKKQWESPLETVIGQTEYKPVDSKTNLTSQIANIIKIFLSLLGIIFVLLTIYAGVLWMTAGGNDEQVAKSKTIIKNCIIGLMVALSAYAITYYVTENIIGVTQGEGITGNKKTWSPFKKYEK